MNGQTRKPVSCNSWSASGTHHSFRLRNSHVGGHPLAQPLEQFVFAGKPAVLLLKGPVLGPLS